MSTDQLMDKLIRAVSYRYKEDKTVPGVTVSALKKGYYCSVVRYGGAFARDKKVVCNAKADDLSGALTALTNKFLSLAVKTKDPVQELEDFIKTA